MEQIENKGLQMKIQFVLASSASIFATEFHLSYSTMKSDENIKINLGMIFWKIVPILLALVEQSHINLHSYLDLNQNVDLYTDFCTNIQGSLTG